MPKKLDKFPPMPRCPRCNKNSLMEKIEEGKIQHECVLKECSYFMIWKFRKTSLEICQELKALETIQSY